MKILIWTMTLFFAMAFTPIDSAAAQTVPPASAADETASSGSAEAISAGNVDSAEADEVPSQFDWLRFLGWCCILVATVSGLGVYAWRHRAAMPGDSTMGLLAVVVVGPLLFTLAILAMSSAAQNCLGRSLRSGVNAVASDGTCRDARERAANLTFLKSAWIAVNAPEETSTGPTPLAVPVVKVLMYLSVLLVPVLLYFLLKGFVRGLLTTR